MNLFDSCIDDCVDQFSSSLTRVTTPRWQRKRKSSLASLPLSPYIGNRSLKTPCKTPRRKTPLKTPKSRKTPHKSPGKATPHFDRFIPNRNAMDSGKNYFQLVNEVEQEKNDYELSPNEFAKVHYEKTVKENLEEESSDSRILHFKQRAPVAPVGCRNNLHVVYSQNQRSSNIPLIHRYISKDPEKILDAPDLMNDFYLNLIDWGPNNCIAIALGVDLYFWNYDTLETKQLVDLLDNCYVSSVAWMHEQLDVLAVGTSDTTVKIFDVVTQKCLRTMTGHVGRVGSLAWNSFYLSSGCRNGKIINHDVRIAEHTVSTLQGHTQDVCGLAWSQDGRTLASGGNDNLLNIWSPFAATEHPLHTLTDHKAAVKGVAWCPWQSNVLASGGGTADRHIRLWNTTTGTCLTSVDTKSQVSSILWSKDYRELVTGHGYDMNQLTIWKYPSMKRIVNLEDHCARVLCMAMSPSGEHVASVAADETLRIWKCFDRKFLKKKSAACGLVMSSSTSLDMSNRIR